MDKWRSGKEGGGVGFIYRKRGRGNVFVLYRDRLGIKNIVAEQKLGRHQGGVSFAL